MEDPETWAVRPLSVRVPQGERRNPVALVRLAVGPLELELAVSRLRKSGLAVRPPMAEGGVPAVGAAPEVWAVIERVAVGAVAGDPAAREHVLGRPSKRAGEPLAAPGPALSQAKGRPSFDGRAPSSHLRGARRGRA